MFKQITIGACLILVAGNAAAVKPRVLIWGDSIALLSFPFLQSIAGSFDLHIIPENGGNSERSLAYLDEWLGEQHWDVIYYNNGIHDARPPGGSPGFTHVPLAQYDANVRLIIAQMKLRADTVIVRASTSVTEPNEFGMLDSDVDIYNATLQAAAIDLGVPYHDLNAVIDADSSITWALPGGIHHSVESRPLVAQHMLQGMLSFYAPPAMPSMKVPMFKERI